jgi:hypothetical protein
LRILIQPEKYLFQFILQREEQRAIYDAYITSDLGFLVQTKQS